MRGIISRYGGIKIPEPAIDDTVGAGGAVLELKRRLEAITCPAKLSIENGVNGNLHRR